MKTCATGRKIGMLTAKIYSNPFSYFSTSDYIHYLRVEIFTLAVVNLPYKVKNAVCTFIKHSRYFNKTYNFNSIHSHT